MLQPKHLILDANCLINLYASGCMGDILRYIPKIFTLTDYVQQAEALFIRNPQETINLQPLIDSGLLTIVSLESETEELQFINLASDLDDGEAMTGAIALQRHWVIATDEQKARAILALVMPASHIVTTLELVKYWADNQQIDFVTIQFVLQQIRRRARYMPPKTHVLYSWWQSFNVY